MPNQSSETKIVGVNKVSVWLSNSKTTLTIAFGGRDDLAAELSTEQVDHMLRVIALWREKMIPPPPVTYTPTKHVTAIRDPAWYAELELSMGGSLFHVRHPGFGWLSIYLPKDEASKLSNLLRA